MTKIEIIERMLELNTLDRIGILHEGATLKTFGDNSNVVCGGYLTNGEYLYSYDEPFTDAAQADYVVIDGTGQTIYLYKIQD